MCIRDRVIKEASAALTAASPTPVIIKTRTMNEIRRDRYRADQAMPTMPLAVISSSSALTVISIQAMALSAR